MKHLLTAILILSLSACSLRAFNVSPMVANFDPNSQRSSQVYVLNNTSDEEKPIEILVARPELTENSRETLHLGEGEDSFLILPQQLVIPPNSRRSVKVFYVGDPVSEEETYRIIFKQLPVSVPTANEGLGEEENKFEMKVVLEYHTRVWVTPKGLKENLAITNFEKIEIETPSTADGASPLKQPMLKLTVANTGNRHGYLRFPTLSIIPNSGQATILNKPEDLQGFAGQVVLGQREREFVIPWQSHFPEVADIKTLRVRTK